MLDETRRGAKVNDERSVRRGSHWCLARAQRGVPASMALPPRGGMLERGAGWAATASRHAAAIHANVSPCGV
jgi:hypothetical protein